MQDDERCCGTGTCIIDAAGRCWCGQQWNGESMCHPPMGHAAASAAEPLRSSPAGHAATQPHARARSGTPRKPEA